MDDSSGVEGDMDTTDIEQPGVHNSSTVKMHLISSYSIVYLLYVCQAVPYRSIIV